CRIHLTYFRKCGFRLFHSVKEIIVKIHIGRVPILAGHPVTRGLYYKFRCHSKPSLHSLCSLLQSIPQVVRTLADVLLSAPGQTLTGFLTFAFTLTFNSHFLICLATAK